MARSFIVIAILSLLSAATCDASWLYFLKPEFKGKIVDIETNEPIEGAVVVAIYRNIQVAIGDSVDRDIEAREALTDRSGEFIIPSFTTFVSPLSWGNTVEFYIFKPGYASLGPASIEEVFSNSSTMPDREISVPWNQVLKYRILKSGVVMLPKVAGKDRIESFRNFYWGHKFKNKLENASSMKLNENKYILTIER